MTGIKGKHIIDLSLYSWEERTLLRPLSFTLACWIVEIMNIMKMVFNVRNAASIEYDWLPFRYTALTDPFLLFRVRLQLDIKAKTPNPRRENSRTCPFRIAKEFGPREIFPCLSVGLQEGRQRRLFRCFGETIFWLDLRDFRSRIHIRCSRVDKIPTLHRRRGIAKRRKKAKARHAKACSGLFCLNPISGLT